ncbi:hypothetical protein ACSBR1_009207 [Camellia fascicularis]
MSMMAGWASNYLKPKSGSLDGNEMVMGLLLSQKKSSLDLMQNCDLPPPVKVFAGPDKAVLSSMNRVYDMVVQEDENDELSGIENEEKLKLLKALQLSQTRAREAEKKAAVLESERDRLRNAFLEDSSRLFGYRQWVKLLELQLSRLQRQQLQWQFCSGCHQSHGIEGSQNMDEDDGDVGGITWFATIALCLSIAGVGFVFSCRYFF